MMTERSSQEALSLESPAIASRVRSLPRALGWVGVGVRTATPRLMASRRAMLVWVNAPGLNRMNRTPSVLARWTRSTSSCSALL